MIMFDTPAYHPQFTPQSPFGGLPGQYGQFGLQFGHQPFGVGMGQPGWPTLAPTSSAPPGMFGNQPGVFGNQFGAMGHTIGGWPSHLQLGGGFAPPIPLGALLGFYGQLLAQAIGGWPGHTQLGGLPPQALLGTLPPYAQLAGHLTGGWPGQAQFAGFGPQLLLGALPGQYGQQIGAISGWPGQQQLGNQFAGVTGRSVLPYQAAPQIAYAG